MLVLLPDSMEVAGAATCLSNCIVCVYFITVLARLGKTEPVLRLYPPLNTSDRQSIAGIFTVGVPSAITTFLFDLDYIVIDRLMHGYTDIAVAAIGIVLKAERLPLNVGVGICRFTAPYILP